jgi:A/G-specific adenine glycosylase
MSGGQALLPDPVELTRLYQESTTLDPKFVRSFQRMIYTHYHATPRPMPWRDTHDPYRILISEIMLQQTQVERVRGKYIEFLDAFPTLTDLASAPLVDVLRVWQGLGYNRRAIALKRCAEEILTRFNGSFPASVPDLESLPGIGHYTARAVAAFAFGQSTAFIETNIRTVFIHFFFHNESTVSDREIIPLVVASIDHGNPREWYYALMDFGVWLKQLHPNPGRRSSHHVQQSRFEGSNRQLRSRLLRTVIASPGISAMELTGLLGAEQRDVERNLADMEREGFLYQTENRYVVCDGTKRG